MDDLYLIVQSKDNTIEKLQQIIKEQEVKIARKDSLIEAQKQALDFLWSRLEDKQHILDREQEHKHQVQMKL